MMSARGFYIKLMYEYKQKKKKIKIEEKQILKMNKGCSKIVVSFKFVETHYNVYISNRSIHR